jgi:transmembrane sensor
MSELISLSLLGRYCDGTASAEERVVVEAWIGSDPSRRAALAAFHAAWAAETHRLDAPYDAEAAWTRIAPRGEPGAGARQLSFRPSHRPSQWPAPAHGAWVATLAIVTTAVGVAWLTLASRGSPPELRPPAPREYATAPGQRAVLRLLDGTEVTLNVASRLRMPAGFADRREVYLQGEAYFSVRHDSLRPFTVHTPRGVTRDLGTRFAVRAYSDEAADRVVVAEGAVALAEIPLHAGQIATLSPAGRVSVLRTGDVTRELGWIHGRLELENVPLGEAARRLGRWYDLDVRVVGSNLARRPVTGSYGNEPIAHVLTVITAAVGARYERHGRSVTIFPAGPTRAPASIGPSPR